MSKSYISSDLRSQVKERANNKCEYCQISEDGIILHEVDHIIPEQHKGKTEESNLALACFDCNRNKGPNISSYSSQGELIPLFNPRQDNWDDHFQKNGSLIEPKSESGQVTIDVLKINDDERVERREAVQHSENMEQATSQSSIENDSSEEQDYYYGYSQ